MVITITGHVRHNGQLLTVGQAYKIEDHYGKRLIEHKAATAGAQMGEDGVTPTIQDITEAAKPRPAGGGFATEAERAAYTAGLNANVNLGPVDPADVPPVTPGGEPEVNITPSKIGNPVTDKK